MFATSTPEIPITPLQDSLFRKRCLDVRMARLDLVHPEVSGNKWFKLKYNLIHAQQHGVNRVVSFGGPFSNHIHALAWAGRQLGIETVGVIRGEPVSNHTLSDAARWGMQLVFVNRKEYRERYSAEYCQRLSEQFGAMVIPEGGSNTLAVQGVAEVVPTLTMDRQSPDVICVATGTGGTIAGVIAGAGPSVRVEGYPVLKGASFLRDDIKRLLPTISGLSSWELDLEAHYGGYGKVSSEHLALWRELEERFATPLDPIYTSKMLRRFLERVEAGCYLPQSKILLLHTGGLQGARSFELSP